MTRNRQLGQLLATTFVALALSACFGGACYAQTPNSSSSSDLSGAAGLQDQLEKGLRCRRPAEFAFVRAVVQLVNDGYLTRQMVVETFAFARKRAGKFGYNYAFPYFQRGLEERAKKAGTPLNIDTTDLYPAAR